MTSIPRSFRTVRLPFILELSGCLLTLTSCAGAGGAGGGSARTFGPKGAPWTILCLEMAGDTRATDIERLAETLRNTPGISPKKVFVRDDSDGVARLYYGDYRWPSSTAGKAAPMPKPMRDDLTLLRQLGDSAGRRFFLRAVPVRMPTSDVGNADWALTMAKGVYTLQVAVFEPTDEFFEYKQAAAEYCKFLREKGHEAYYYHTNAASMVTVGSFGPEAVIKPPPDVAHREYLKSGTMVLPAYSSEVLALQQDELLKYNLHNGGVRYTRLPTGNRVPELSQLVEIPHTTPKTP